MSEAEGGTAGVRLAVVLDSPCPAWQREVVVRLAASVSAAVVLLVDAAGVEPRGRTGGAALRLLAARLSRSRALRTVARPAVRAVPRLRARLRRADQDGAAVLEDDLASIREAAPDVVLWLPAARPVGGIVDAARHGVWWFQFGAESSAPRELIGSSEHLAHEAVVEARLLAERPGGPPVILRSGAFAVDALSWARTRDRVLFGVAGWPALGCRAVRLGAAEDAPELPVAGSVSGARTAVSAARLVVGMAAALAQRLWHHGFRHDDWNIGVVEAPVASFLTADGLPAVDWAPVRAGHYAADPFGRWDGATLQVVFEDWEHARGAASLARRGWRRGEGWLPASPLLDVGSHQSYPFLFEQDDRLCLLPESRAAGALVLYAAQGIDGPWRPAATLDVPGGVADATLLHHADRWWLFAIYPDRLNPATQLGLWFADRPEGPWQEHPLSPVLTDVRSARPGGPCFIADGQLYRPAQDCSTGYGDRLAIKRITALTTERYAEELVRIVRPDPDGAFAFGLHTLTGVGAVTLIDGKRRVHDWGAVRAALQRRIGR